MLFNSISFGIFLIIVFALYWIVPNKFRTILLFISSCYFYMSWNPKYILLIFFMITVSYFSGKIIQRSDNKRKRKAILTLTICLCIGALFFFKYFNFISDNIVNLAKLLSIQLQPVTLDILLPVGISFYTFQTLSYVIDIYRGKVEEERNFIVFATFISFFPQLVAGPIERSTDLLPQIKSEKRFSYENASYGLKLMAWGFFKKLAIANLVAPYVDKAYSSIASCTGFDILFMMPMFAIQIYCDFSGYSDIAIGTARLFGIKLSKNFISPYFANSISDMWHRWHISLSTWLRDYIYIPLGGSRVSKVRRVYNLVITFFVSGLWHGANWTYVIWGLFHGFAQAIAGLFPRRNKKKSGARNLFSMLAVFIFWCVTWVFFRADSITDAFEVFKKLFGSVTNPSTFVHQNIGLTPMIGIEMLVGVIILAIFDYASLRVDVIEWLSKKKTLIRWSVYVLLIWLTVTFMPFDSGAPFVYFQF